MKKTGYRLSYLPNTVFYLLLITPTKDSPLWNSSMWDLPRGCSSWQTAPALVPSGVTSPARKSAPAWTFQSVTVSFGHAHVSRHFSWTCPQSQGPSDMSMSCESEGISMFASKFQPLSPEEELQGQPWALPTVMRWLLVHLWLPVKALLSLLIGGAGCMCICVSASVQYVLSLVLAHTHGSRSKQTRKESSKFNFL